MWLAHVFGQRGTKNKIKLTKAFNLFSYPIVLLLKKNKQKQKQKKTKLKKKKKETEQKAGALAKKKRKKETKKQSRRKGLRPPVSQSNIFPLHLRWLKRQSVTSFYPFFVCFHFLVRRPARCVSAVSPDMADTARVDMNQLDSAQIGPSLSRVGASRKKKKKKVAGRGPMQH